MKSEIRKIIVIGAATMIMGIAATGSVSADETEISVDDLFTNEINGTDMTSIKKITYVIDGFEFTCPPEYEMIYFDEVGPTVYIPDSFQMRTVVRPVGYDETLQDRDAMTAKAIAAGAEITKEVTETEVNGVRVAYFRMDMEGDDMMAMFCESPNPDYSFGGQFAVQNPNLQEDEILKIFTDVMSTAVETDAPNSTREDIDEQVYAPEPIGEAKKESTLKKGDTEVTFKVDENFYSVFDSDCDFYASETFEMEDFTTADIFVYDVLEAAENAKDYIDQQADLFTDRAEFDIETRDVNGYTFYCFAVNYKYEDSDMKRVYAACDLNEGGMYLVESTRIDGEEELTVDTIQAFLEIQE